MLRDTDRKRWAGAGPVMLPLGVILSLAIHVVALWWWATRPVPEPVQFGMQSVTVDLIAAPAPVAQPPAAVAPPPAASPPPAVLQPDEMAVTHKVVKKKPPEQKPRPPVEQPQQPLRDSPPAAAATASPAAASTARQPAAESVTAARYDADYLNNPAPAYPSLSRRLGEEGRVVLRVQVSAAGQPLSVELKHSSGHARLDEAARKAATRWRFVPARQGGEAVASWVEVPIQFSLQQ